MGLLRGVARTAVVAGTATAVSNRVSRRQGNRWAQQGAEQEQQEQEPAPQQQYAAPPPAPSGVDYETKLSQLKQLGELRDAGVLNDAEFEMQKSKILNS
jgi:soluble lytic murein transglycosylase-like protein